MLLPVVPTFRAFAVLGAAESCAVSESWVGYCIRPDIREIAYRMAMRFVDCNNFTITITIVLIFNASSIGADCSRLSQCFWMQLNLLQLEALPKAIASKPGS